MNKYYEIYRILSDEEWNGQTKPEDFKEVEKIGECDTLEEYIENWQNEDTIYKVVEIW